MKTKRAAEWAKSTFKGFPIREYLQLSKRLLVRRSLLFRLAGNLKNYLCYESLNALPKMCVLHLTQKSAAKCSFLWIWYLI